MTQTTMGCRMLREKGKVLTAKEQDYPLSKALVFSGFSGRVYPCELGSVMLFLQVCEPSRNNSSQREGGGD